MDYLYPGSMQVNWMTSDGMYIDSGMGLTSTTIMDASQGLYVSLYTDIPDYGSFQAQATVPSSGGGDYSSYLMIYEQSAGSFAGSFDLNTGTGSVQFSDGEYLELGGYLYNSNSGHMVYPYEIYSNGGSIEWYDGSSYYLGSGSSVYVSDASDGVYVNVTYDGQSFGGSSDILYPEVVNYDNNLVIYEQMNGSGSGYFDLDTGTGSVRFSDGEYLTLDGNLYDSSSGMYVSAYDIMSQGSIEWYDGSSSYLGSGSSLWVQDASQGVYVNVTYDGQSFGNGSGDMLYPEVVNYDNNLIIFNQYSSNGSAESFDLNTGTGSVRFRESDHLALDGYLYDSSAGIYIYASDIYAHGGSIEWYDNSSTYLGSGTSLWVQDASDRVCT